jgi:hypothetical protein
MHLTYPNSDPDIGTVSPADSGEAGAPEDEIEITPGMMEVGVEAFYGYDPGDMEPERCVEAIYLAMETLRRASDKSQTLQISLASGRDLGKTQLA